jgi:mono/diheme cytochrome c family protein
MSLYDAQCAVCHQRAAVGAPGQFPRLAGRVAAIAGHADGRAYLVGVLRNGLSGSIKVDGATVAGLMPPFPQLSADELASILNYLTSLGPTPPRKPQRFDGAEVAKLSARVASPQQLMAERESLASAGVIP